MSPLIFLGLTFFWKTWKENFETEKKKIWNELAAIYVVANSFMVSSHNFSNNLDVVVLFLAATYVDTDSYLEYNLYPAPSSLFSVITNSKTATQTALSYSSNPYFPLFITLSLFPSLSSFWLLLLCLCSTVPPPPLLYLAASSHI